MLPTQIKCAGMRVTQKGLWKRSGAYYEVCVVRMSEYSDVVEAFERVLSDVVRCDGTHLGLEL